MENVTDTDLTGQAIAELYSGDPDAFVARRRELYPRAGSFVGTDFPGTTMKALARAGGLSISAL